MSVAPQPGSEVKNQPQTLLTFHREKTGARRRAIPSHASQPSLKNNGMDRRGFLATVGTGGPEE